MVGAVTVAAGRRAGVHRAVGRHFERRVARRCVTPLLARRGAVARVARVVLGVQPPSRLALAGCQLFGGAPGIGRAVASALPPLPAELVEVLLCLVGSGAVVVAVAVAVPRLLRVSRAAAWGRSFVTRSGPVVLAALPCIRVGSASRMTRVRTVILRVCRLVCMRSSVAAVPMVVLAVLCTRSGGVSFHLRIASKRANQQRGAPGACGCSPSQGRGRRASREPQESCVCFDPDNNNPRSPVQRYDTLTAHTKKKLGV